MIRLASISPGRVISDGLLCSSRRTKSLGQRSASSATRHFSSTAKDDEKPKGIPYSKLTVGVPKERFPLEKRVAATPEV
jgi:NAD(P) transhydrogenase